MRDGVTFASTWSLAPSQCDRHVSSSCAEKNSSVCEHLSTVLLPRDAGDMNFLKNIASSLLDDQANFTDLTQVRARAKKKLAATSVVLAAKKE